jgi:hypothetical protein
MNNWCICWFFTHVLLGILIFKGLSARRLYKSFGVKGLINTYEFFLSFTRKKYSALDNVQNYNYSIYYDTG